MSLPRLRLLPPLVVGVLACSGHSLSPETAPVAPPSNVTLSAPERLGRELFLRHPPLAAGGPVLRLVPWPGDGVDGAELRAQRARCGV